MIHCTKCGTTNAGGTRFCSECGAPLIHTGQLCADCGAMNPVGTVFCDNCNARLVPPSGIQDMDTEPGIEEEAPRAPIKGLSLPTIPLEGDPTAETGGTAPADEGAWLSDLRASVGEETLDQPQMEGVESSGVAQDTTADAPDLSQDPDWLKQLQADSPFPDSEPAPEREDTPEWLDDLQAQTPPLTVDSILAEETPGAESPSVEIAPSEGTVLPDWLEDLGTATPPAPEAAPPPADGGTPEWLTELSAESAAAPEATASTPDWLEGLDTAPELTPQAELPHPDGPPTPTLEAETTPPGTAAPDWLEELNADPAFTPETQPPLADETGVSPGPAPDAQAPPALTGATDWLQGLADERSTTPATGILPGTGTLPDWLERLGTGALPTLPTDAEGKVPVPDWLEGIEKARRGDTGPLEPTVVEQAPAVQPVLPSEEISIPVESGDLPDWLTQTRSAAEGEPPPSGVETDAQLPAAPEGSLPDGLAPAEIPEWMQALRPGTEVEAPDEPPETEGLLEGMRGTLHASPAIDEIGQMSEVPLITSAASIARAQLLQELLSRPAEPPQATKQKRRAKLGLTVQNMLVSLLFLVAIIAPMTGVQLYDSDAVIPTTDLYTNSVEVFDLIEAQVQPEDSVLLVFAYDASNADEMSRVAEPIVLHLLQKGARLTPVSTLPEGPALAERLISRLTASTQLPSVVTPVYQPGQAAGVQSLLTDASDVTMVVVLSGEPGEFRTWLEQVRVRFVDMPIVAGISARVETDARPYLSAQSNLKGIVVGLIGAAAYESSIDSIYRPAGFYLQALALSHLVVVGLILVGGVVFMIGGKNR